LEDGGSRDGGIDIIKPFLFLLNIKDLGQAAALGAVGWVRLAHLVDMVVSHMPMPPIPFRHAK